MKDCLVLFSGGKDSFLTACKKIEEGYRVYMLSFNNGSVACEENFAHGANRIIERYGEDKAVFVGVISTVGTIQTLRHKYANIPMLTLADMYPSIRLAQLTCLNCQTCMWVSAIAYAVAKGIKVISSGYRRTDEFCTGDKRWIEYVQDLAGSFEVTVDTPIFENDEWVELDGWYRDLEMNRRGFLGSVLEPKCTLGMATSKMSADEQEDTYRYFSDFVWPELHFMIEELIPIYKVIRISLKSLV